MDDLLIFLFYLLRTSIVIQLQEETACCLSNWKYLNELVEKELVSSSLQKNLPCFQNWSTGVQELIEEVGAKSVERATTALLKLAQRSVADVTPKTVPECELTGFIDIAPKQRDADSNRNPPEDDNAETEDPASPKRAKADVPSPSTSVFSIFELAVETQVEIFKHDEEEGTGCLFKFSCACKNARMTYLALLNSKPSLAFGKFSSMIRWRMFDLEFRPQLRESFILAADLELAKIVSLSYGPEEALSLTKTPQGPVSRKEPNPRHAGIFTGSFKMPCYELVMAILLYLFDELPRLISQNETDSEPAVPRNSDNDSGEGDPLFYYKCDQARNRELVLNMFSIYNARQYVTTDSLVLTTIIKQLIAWRQRKQLVDVFKHCDPNRSHDSVDQTNLKSYLIHPLSKMIVVSSPCDGDYWAFLTLLVDDLMIVASPANQLELLAILKFGYCQLVDVVVRKAGITRVPMFSKFAINYVGFRTTFAETFEKLVLSSVKRYLEALITKRIVSSSVELQNVITDIDSQQPARFLIQINRAHCGVFVKYPHPMLESASKLSDRQIVAELFNFLDRHLPALVSVDESNRHLIIPPSDPILETHKLSLPWVSSLLPIKAQIYSMAYPNESDCMLIPKCWLHPIVQMALIADGELLYGPSTRVLSENIVFDEKAKNKEMAGFPEATELLCRSRKAELTRRALGLVEKFPPDGLLNIPIPIDKRNGPHRREFVLSPCPSLMLDKTQLMWDWNGDDAYTNGNQLTAFIARMLLGMVEEEADDTQSLPLAGFPNFMTAVSFLNRFLLNSSFGYFSFVYREIAKYRKEQRPEEHCWYPGKLAELSKSTFLRLTPKFLERYCDLLSSALEELLEVLNQGEPSDMSKFIGKYCQHLINGVIDEIYYGMICSITDSRLARLARVLMSLWSRHGLSLPLQLLQFSEAELSKTRLILAKEIVIKKFTQLRQRFQEEDTLEDFITSLAIPIALQDCFASKLCSMSTTKGEPSSAIQSEEEYQFLLSLNIRLRKLFHHDSDEYRNRSGMRLDYELKCYESRASGEATASTRLNTYTRVETGPIVANPLFHDTRWNLILVGGTGN